MVGALCASAGTVLTHARRGNQIKRAGPKSVRSAGKRTYGADLHGIAGEVRLEGLIAGDANLLQRTTFQQLDERITGDLLGKPGAARA
ncbi:Uncharacterised protein [Mycobacteroides abscessus subsp. abscessus]|nr:Uncharacterised protein [Mycobacteroides abscessus subsp. abscessus]